MPRKVLLGVAVACMLCGAVSPHPVRAENDSLRLPTAETVLKTLRKEHPRLIGIPEEEARLKRALKTDPKAQAIYAAVKREADAMLTAAPIEHKLVGPRLLTQSRRCLDRVVTLATVYRIEGDRKYADRAIREMLTAASFKDWNPSHFLDTAEMTNALAIGYDWLYDVLTPEQRETIRKAIVEKGLLEARKIYEKKSWWTQTAYNWNQVCNGGIGNGALAIADEEPELAAYILDQALHSIPKAMATYAPDGAWDEGPGYWNYATRYTVYFLAGLTTALGTDFGLSNAEGFDHAGDFRIQLVGPTKLSFNFADGHEGTGSAACMFWLARRFDNPVYAWHEREYIGGKTAWHLWWYDPRGNGFGDMPADCWFKRAGIVLLRSGWDDEDTFVGFKGGSNAVNHSHLEAGMFVLDMIGERWIFDLGSDNYNLPAYFGGKRWTYYRLGTIGQNTLVIGGENQNPKGKGEIVAFHSDAASSSAVIDLSSAYPNAKKVQRGIRIFDRTGDVLVQDEVVDTHGQEIVWQAHTKAKVSLEGSEAVLSLDGKKLYAKVFAPADARFTTLPCTPPEPQNQNRGVTKLGVRIDDPGESVVIAVGFSARPIPAKTVRLQPLADWPKE
ncbi:hypothetical protein JCM19992_31400 [Thermostilla marina]